MSDENKELDAFLGGSTPPPANPAPPPQEAMPEQPSLVEQPRDEQGRFAPKTDAQPQPEPTPQVQPQPQSGHVPIAAMLEERDKRKALEAEAMALRQQLQQLQRPQQPAPDLYQDPEQWQQYQTHQIDEALFTNRLATSSYLATVQFPDYAEKEAAFVEAAQQNPALGAALRQHPAPAFFAYEEGKRILMAKEIGNDPAAYRARLEQEIRQKVEQELAQRYGAQPVPQQTALPPSSNSLGGGSPPRNPVNGWNGPPSLESIIGRDAMHRPR